jgi:lipopolysaccharide transport system ATP-binding protein
LHPILEIKDISKKFRISHEHQRYLSLRDSIIDFFSGKRKSSREDFWALKDVSFNVFPGDSIAIIGKNGAGKSTFLKILSKITPPTSGKIKSRGRIASLLEVGTGFHPELTGRENIYLNGSILGMKRMEINSKFDEIVEFSGVERFLDTPLKHYSSGMQLRLAFAVAAFLEPEILVIDEVLAVGDAEFQKKCMGKMDEVSKSGRTIIFVSHNMNAVSRLCNSGIYLKQGKVAKLSANINELINAYLTDVPGANGDDLAMRTDRMGSGEIRIKKITITSMTGERLDMVTSGQDFNIVLSYECAENIPERIPGLVASVIMLTTNGSHLLLHHNRLTGDDVSEIKKRGSFSLQVKQLPLVEGTYAINYSIMHGNNYYDFMENAFRFKVVAGHVYNYVELPPSSHGSFLINAKWHVDSKA